MKKTLSANFITEPPVRNLTFELQRYPETKRSGHWTKISGSSLLIHPKQYSGLQYAFKVKKNVILPLFYIGRYEVAQQQEDVVTHVGTYLYVHAETGTIYGLAFNGMAELKAYESRRSFNEILTLEQLVTNVHLVCEFVNSHRETETFRRPRPGMVIPFWPASEYGDKMLLPTPAEIEQILTWKHKPIFIQTDSGKNYIRLSLHHVSIEDGIIASFQPRVKNESGKVEGTTRFHYEGASLSLVRITQREFVQFRRADKIRIEGPFEEVTESDKKDTAKTDEANVAWFMMHEAREELYSMSPPEKPTASGLSYVTDPFLFRFASSVGSSACTRNAWYQSEGTCWSATMLNVITLTPQLLQAFLATPADTVRPATIYTRPAGTLQQTLRCKVESGYKDDSSMFCFYHGPETACKLLHRLVDQGGFSDDSFENLMQAVGVPISKRANGKARFVMPNKIRKALTDAGGDISALPSPRSAIACFISLIYEDSGHAMAGIICHEPLLKFYVVDSNHGVEEFNWLKFALSPKTTTKDIPKKLRGSRTVKHCHIRIVYDLSIMHEVEGDMVDVLKDVDIERASRGVPKADDGALAWLLDWIDNL